MSYCLCPLLHSESTNVAVDLPRRGPSYSFVWNNFYMREEALSYWKMASLSSNIFYLSKFEWTLLYLLLIQRFPFPLVYPFAKWITLYFCQSYHYLGMNYLWKEKYILNIIARTPWYFRFLWERERARDFEAGWLIGWLVGFTACQPFLGHLMP